MIKKIYQYFMTNWISYGFETLVVIAGILIAFALQNWNEARKEESRELEYLCRLHQNLVRDTSYFQSSASLCNTLIEQNQNALRTAYDQQKTLPQYRRFLDQINTYTIPFQIEDATYRDLISTGNINIFRNDSLKIDIIQYYRDCEYKEKDVDQLNKLYSEVFANAISEGLLLGKYMRGDSSLLLPSMINPNDWSYMEKYDSPQFKALYSVVSFTVLKNQFFALDFEDLDKKAVHLLLQIDAELEKRE